MEAVPEMPYDPIAELETLSPEYGIENGVERNDLTVVDKVSNLPTNRSTQMK